MQKSEPRRGDAKLGGSGDMPPQKILRNLTLVWRLFGRFEPLRYLSFNKIYSLFYSDLIQSVGYRLRKTLIAFFGCRLLTQKNVCKGLHHLLA